MNQKLETKLSLLESSLMKINWDSMPKMSSVNTRHELIKSKIVYWGMLEGYMSIPEFHPFKENAKKIDAGWFNGDIPIVAFEVDGTVKKNSVTKLKSLSDNCVKVIVSKSNTKSRINKRVEKLLPEGFYHIDCGLHRYRRPT